MSKPVLLRLGPLALVAAAVALRDDGGAGSPDRCREAVRRGDWHLASAFCQAAFDAEPHVETRVLLARARMSLGRDDEALALLPDALGTRARPQALQLTGLLLDRRGDTEAARAALSEALVLLRAQGDARESARAAYALAGSYFRTSHYRDTLVHLDAAERDARATGDARMLGYVALLRGDVLRAVGHADGAEGAYREVEPLFASSRADLAYLRLKTGMLHRNASRLALARGAFEEALALGRDIGLREVESAARLNLAFTAHLLGDVDGGFRYLADWPDPLEVPYRYNRAMLLSDRGALAEAAALLDGAARDATSDEWAWDIAHERGRIAERTGDMESAERAYRSSIAIVERMRADLDLADLSPWVLRRRRAPYEALFTLLVRRGKAKEALEALESFTARSFLDSLLRAERPPPATTTAEAALVRADAARDLWRGLRGPAGDADLESRLGDREVLIHVEARGRLWGLHRLPAGRVDIHDLGPAADVRAVADRFQAQPDDETAARSLGEALIPAAVGASDEILYLVPTGMLLGLPLAALRRGPRLLVEDRPLALAPSVRALATPPLPAPSSESAVLADPDGSLPQAREEAAQVAALLGTPAFVQADATRARLLNTPSRRILHIAAHAGVDDGGSWIRLADGRWTDRDVLRSKLRADVVVLAGCASAATRLDEMWGSLAAAFLANGSGAVIATLGSVDDSDARALVTALYRHGVTTDPVRALAAAQRERARSLPPSRWALFAVYGDSPRPPR